jgi:hypothetical protein
VVVDPREDEGEGVRKGEPRARGLSLSSSMARLLLWWWWWSWAAAVGDDLSVVVVRLVVDRGDGSSLSVGSHVCEVLVIG